ncbi:hypothetical protein SHKM778_31890 [Streptomyces sp. KM77-8]|uniref:Uncharacterized protein n=1 Tax=Streptomyces haneummycinicus TaxID=3074435 RepID=A0AAT9HH27_9ACTN
MAGVGGQVARGGEAAAVTDVDKDAGRGPDPDAGHGGQDLRKRVRLQQFLDPDGKEFALVKHGGERGGQAGDDQRRSVGAGHDDALLVERVEDVRDESIRQARCPGLQHGYQPSPAGFP